MKRLFFIFTAAMMAISAMADNNYEDWEHEDVTGIYVEISNLEAKRNGYDESFDDGDVVRYFSKVRLQSGLYEVTVYEKVDSKFWGIQYTKYYMKFRFNPFLFKFDEGVLDWDGYDGVFYKKP